MPAKHLLLCFDAFGTLFKPKYSIVQQYGDVARALGHSGFTDDDVSQSFRAAYKSESKANPNYGKANGMNAEKWWTNIIRNTFRPLLGPEQQLHQDLVPRLLHRFSGAEGYALFPDVMPLLRRLREAHESSETRMVVGVVTNSDDRVPDVLVSLGLDVRKLRYGSEAASSPKDRQSPHDIDFSVMSYDVGHEKPDHRMFQAAEEMLKQVLKGADTESSGELDQGQWRKVYVGDEYDKDVVGALNASWNAVLVERDGAGKRGDVLWLDEQPVGSLYEVFDREKAVGFSSLAKLAEWLPSRLS